MPLREYQCASCGEVVELLVRSEEKKKPACPRCARKMEKKLSVFSASTGVKFGGGCQSGGCGQGPGGFS